MINTQFKTEYTKIPNVSEKRKDGDSMYYNRCQVCDAYLDPGEQCDCEKTNTIKKKKQQTPSKAADSLNTVKNTEVFSHNYCITDVF